MNGNPTAAQERFHKWCRLQGCMVIGSENPALHHIKGSKMKLKGVKNAGEWYVIPLSYFWHQDGSNDSAVHINKRKFESDTATQKIHWRILIRCYEAEFGEKPMSQEEYQIIVDRA